jgi:hypothetical protein
MDKPFLLSFYPAWAIRTTSIILLILVVLALLKELSKV